MCYYYTFFFAKYYYTFISISLEFHTFFCSFFFNCCVTYNIENKEGLGDLIIYFQVPRSYRLGKAGDGDSVKIKNHDQQIAFGFPGNDSQK